MCGSARTSRASAICWAWASVSLVAAGADHGVEPGRQGVDPVEGVDRRQRRPDGRRRSAPGRGGQGEVLAQGADEDVVLLGHQGDVAAQVGERELDQADAADGDRAGPRRVDPGEQPAQRRLAGAGRTDHGEPGARLDVEVDAVQHVAPARRRRTGRRVASISSPSGSRAGDLAVVGDLGDAEQPGERRRADLELVEDRHDPVDRVDQHLHVEDGRGHLAQRHRPLRVEVAAEEQRADGGDQVGQLHAREEHGAQVERVALRGVGLLDGLVDGLDPPLPEAERLDGAGALDGLGEGRVHDRVGRVLAQVAVLGAGEVPAQPDDQRRDAEQARDRDPPADADRGHERDDRRDHARSSTPAAPSGPTSRAGRRRGWCGSAGRRSRPTRRRRRAARARCRRSPRAAPPAPSRRAPGWPAGRTG